MNGYGESPFYNGGGGGYLSQSSTLGSGGAGSPGGSARRAASHTLRPVMLKQLVEATQEHSDADWKIGDVEIGQVMVVAHVISVQVQTTNCVYLLEDGTAQFEARQWVDANSEEDGGKREISEGGYVRVLGSLKLFGQKRYITATHINQIPEKSVCDEICFHITEAAAMSVILERGPPPRPSEGPVPTRSNAKGTPSAYKSGQSTSVNENPEYAGLPPLEKQIVQYMQNQQTTDEGINVGEIARYVASHGGPGNARLISEALDRLGDNGLVYSTIDDSHFRLAA